MSSKVEWIAQISRGRLIIPNREAFLAAVSQLEDGTVPMRIGGGNKRSSAQNRWLWGVAYPMIAEKLGYETWEVHEVMKLKLNPVHLEIGDEVMTVGGSTAKMSKERFSEYKEQLQRWAAQFLGLYIPDPNEVPIGAFDEVPG